MRFLTAGESHGPQLTAIIEGVPAQLPLLAEDIDRELARRQGGYGRGRRMQIEKDRVQIVSGVRHGMTTGAPITFVVENKDWKNWTKIMGAEPISEEEAEKMRRKLTRPRPGHADLNGAIKYGHRDMRNVLERSSARETTVRVACGALAKVILKACGIEVAGHVREIGGIRAEETNYATIQELQKRSEESPVRCLDEDASKKMMAAIDKAKQDGDSIGGIVEVVVAGVPIGLGSHVHYDRKLDGKIAGAVMSINAFKGVEIGIGFEAARLPGSQVHDEITWSEEEGYKRKTNRLGGFEGGMTNGMPIVVKGVMKPIPTLYKPLQSVDIDSKEPFAAGVERSDSCAVPAASVVCENVVAWEVANALLDTFGSDQLPLIQAAVERHHAASKEF
ncbi:MULTISPECIES: chorismate synthase [Shouchella]|uniref:Chorismate synthase n=2 Tax=Shouchella TaxID=2893057 RepID=AROC_SHOC1|nr:MULTISPECIES: chorismate synthase [Shouchella]Q5WGS8.1 RecName: Full=Chorismate synthase; Short=CS; AltName: Full=5-enolpyruvylshikimate-3-phosphate phospholyase [Shouchella clausii KSM-K16]KKI85738.1 chorismate synthase [Shouchella clausii]MBX0318588.1 chorismate synthase [Shouchella clausii]MCM3379355.1 chorismate synthase [Shouchella rhizosphaerae]MDO7268301.1 chorismate synthase [Shouchella clausii]MDO7283145.1 chorismate synthase [Shouchella clausii]